MYLVPDEHAPCLYACVCVWWGRGMKNNRKPRVDYDL